MVLAKELKKFIEEDLLDGERINESTELFTSGMLDSVSLVSLLSFINEKFHVKIPSSQITMENMNTIDSLVMLINK